MLKVWKDCCILTKMKKDLCFKIAEIWTWTWHEAAVGTKSGHKEICFSSLRNPTETFVNKSFISKSSPPTRTQSSLTIFLVKRPVETETKKEAMSNRPF